MTVIWTKEREFKFSDQIKIITFNLYDKIFQTTCCSRGVVQNLGSWFTPDVNNVASQSARGVNESVLLEGYTVNQYYELPVNKLNLECNDRLCGVVRSLRFPNINWIIYTVIGNKVTLTVLAFKHDHLHIKMKEIASSTASNRVYVSHFLMFNLLIYLLIKFRGHFSQKNVYEKRARFLQTILELRDTCSSVKDEFLTTTP